MSPVPSPSLALLDVLASVEPVSGLVFSSLLPDFAGLADAVRNASGLIGLAIIGLYSFLIAFILPLPSEVVLAPVRAGTLALGLPSYLEYAIVIVVSGVGKAAGSVFAFHIGQEAKEAGPIVRFLRRSRFDIIEWSEKKSVELARKYGYVGLAMALSVPFFPDTISIYAFAVLERDYKKFALATFAGSVGRLLVTMGAFGVAFVFL